MTPRREPEFGSAISEVTVLALGRWTASLLSLLGVEVLRELKRFSKMAGPGAMITIRRTRGGFTAQVTDAIIGGRAHGLSQGQIGRLAQNGERRTDEGERNVI